MQKVVVHIRAVLGRLLVAGLSVQIVLGLLWMCCSFTGVQWFTESAFYVKVSESLICDEYTGILYPFLLMLTKENFVGLCLMQVAAALGAGYAFLRGCGIKSPLWRIWGSLALLTYPMAMQTHMAILPDSFVFSCFLLELSFVLSAVRKDRDCWRTELLGVHGMWLVSALLVPDYLWLGAVPVALFWIYDVVKYRRTAGRRVCYHFLLAAVFAGMIVTVGSLTSSDGYYGRADRSFASALFRRTGWSCLASYYMEWPPEVREAVSEEAFLEAIDSVRNMEWQLQPEIERAVGVDAARALYTDIGMRALAGNYSRIIYETLWDALGNVFPLLTMQELLEGRGYVSYCARNYETMRQHSPLLTFFYMEYATWWFAMGLAVTFILWLAGMLRQRQLFPALVCILSAAATAAWYVMVGVGAWDYKKGLFTGALWIIWMLVTAVKGLEEEQYIWCEK